MLNAEQNPFISKDVPCPICQIPTYQARIKRHLYVEQALDVDHRPQSYSWKAKGLESLYPHLYYMWHCPQCCFTASTQVFEEPAKYLTPSMEEARAAFTRATRNEPAVQKALYLLSVGLTTGGLLDHQQAVRLHWLAIYTLLLLAKGSKAPDYLGLGRYTLRLAWLWRDLEQNPPLAQDAAPTLNKVAQDMAELWPQIPVSDLAASLQAAKFYEAILRDPLGLEKVGDPGEILLLIARIYIHHRQLEPARHSWSQAWDLARRQEMLRKDLENRSYRLQEKLRSASSAQSAAIKQELDELRGKLIKTENSSRSLRQKSSGVRDLLDDLQAQSESQVKEPEPQAKKKGLRGLFS